MGLDLIVVAMALCLPELTSLFLNAEPGIFSSSQSGALLGKGGLSGHALRTPLAVACSLSLSPEPCSACPALGAGKMEMACVPKELSISLG